MSTYFAFARSTFMAQLSYRNEIWTSIFYAVVLVMAKSSIWQSVYSGQAEVKGVSLEEMTTYALVGTTIYAAWSYPVLIRNIDQSLKSGEIASQLLKPVSYPVLLFANEVGNFCYGTLSKAVPAAAVAITLYGILPPASASHGLLFVAFWLLSFAMAFVLAVVAGLVAFWLMTATTMDWLLGAMLSVFGGLWAPLWFFPAPLRTIAELLPFAWIGFYPSAVYLGHLSVGDSLLSLGVGSAWVAALWGVALLLWRAARARLVVQGG